ncbi:MAG: integrase core domain-containing protein [Planctomycetaceae bacterium]
MVSVFGRLTPRLQQAIVARHGWSSLLPVKELTSEAFLSGKNAVILAPTAGGKTEASMFPTLSNLVDRGGQYVSTRYRAVLRCAGMSQSMSGAGNCYDNAFMERCFGTIKTELQLVDYADHLKAQRELSSYLRYYNHARRHSSLGYDTPTKFKQNHPQQTAHPTSNRIRHPSALAT